MKKANLGFKVLSLDHELRVPTPAEIAHNTENLKLDSKAKRRESQLRCYHKNKEKYNRQKRSVARRIEGRYEEAKRQAVLSGAGWDFDLETWERVWQEAGWVVVPGSQSAQRPEGLAVPAFSLRGPNRYNNTCMVRVNYGKPWGPENVKIMFRGEELTEGSRWSAKRPEFSGESAGKAP